MARVISTCENQPTSINGVKFTEDRGQFISEEITEDQAAYFCKVPGYRLVGAASDDGGEGVSAKGTAGAGVTSAKAPTSNKDTRTTSS